MMFSVSAMGGHNPFKMSPMGTQSMTGFKPVSFQDKGFVGATDKKPFESVLGNMVKDMDMSMKEPEQLMNRYLTVGDIDVHDVMMANAKSDITINVASQVATKIIQAYERIQQIQV